MSTGTHPGAPGTPEEVELDGRPTLTTTSYAILGLLGIRPLTSYEFTQQMQRSLSRFWPRAASKLYEEPKKLVAHGLATGVVHHVGRRVRSRYSITPRGRRELAEWLAQPGQGPVIEFEALVKVVLAEHGTKQDLLASLARVTAWTQQQTAQHAQIAHSYLTGSGQFRSGPRNWFSWAATSPTSPR